MLTGQTRYRLGWRGKIVLQVSVWQRRFARGGHPDFQPWIAIWRDASFRDVIDLAEGQFSGTEPISKTLPPPPIPRGHSAQNNLPPSRMSAPPMPEIAPARAPTVDRPSTEPTFYDVGIKAERGIEYRFLGATGMEDQ